MIEWQAAEAKATGERVLFSWYIVWYLFLAGVGSGMFLVAFCLCAWDAMRPSTESERAVDAVQAGLLAVPCVMAAAVLMLALDVGNLERIWQIALMPFASVMSLGAWFVAVLTVCSGAIAVSQALSLRMPATFRWLVSGIGAVAAVGTMVYNGLLLSSMVSIDFWHTPLLTLLFAVSALSTGAAALMGLHGAFGGGTFAANRALWRIGATCGAVEAVALAAFLLAQSGFTDVSRASCANLVAGDLAPLFWGVVVVAGLVLPLCAHGAAIRRAPSQALTVATSSGILAGGLALRYCVVTAALYTPLALGWPVG